MTETFAFDPLSLVPEPVDDPEFMQPPEPDVDGNENYDRPVVDFVKKPRAKAHTSEYERKLRGFFNTVFRFAVGQEKTVPDAAAIYMYGPQLTEAWAKAAAEDKRIANAIDFFTTPTESPLAAAVMTSIPLALQLLRNHEPQVETETRGIRLPFTKRRLFTNLKFRFRFTRLHPLSHDPQTISQHVFTDERVVENMRKQNISVPGFIKL